ncbi:tannase and feruloyl esterase [Schizophyllum commune H4-8]|uniref:Carboxylic ester hydrolase n=1 Tax=Schizophyllum commune (strain H4-8 / FGSC 9210) TaxID=578458 RepID=D8QHD4_SCHCM|nr:tannase and feruloyl esterase [Schizophyllum commune H4-8]KAI5887136.1 tannase and feruloyl esterase [Schizophyllum commune H4-8]
MRAHGQRTPHSLMSSYRSIPGVLLSTLALLGVTHVRGDFASDCSALIDQISLDNVTVLSTDFVAAGTNVSLGNVPASCKRPSHHVASSDLCRAVMNVSTSARSGIRMEAWFPKNYTGRFLSAGNGGLGGCIQHDDLDYAASLGFAAVGANNGHDGITGEPFFNNPDVVADFAWRSLHTGVVVGKQLVETFYGVPHNKSYYLGCSTGGRQGFKAVQDFPDDFDGVVAGAPAFAWTEMLFWAGTLFMTTGTPEDPTFVSTHDGWTIIHDEVLKQCDALDGAADGILENPDLCNFDLTSLICADDNATNCLTETQAETVRAVLSPVYDKDGSVLHPRMQPGAEYLAGLVASTGQPSAVTTDWYRYVIYNDTTWDPTTLSLDDYTAARVQNPAGVDSYKGDLSAFAASGGKVLHYHGLADGLITSDNSKRYYAHVQQTMNKQPAELDDFYRFFPISGMSHCIDGQGAYRIGNVAGAAGMSADENVLMSMVRWVEEGVAPEVVRGVDANGTYWRAHCKWPKTNKYVGPGAYEDESAWQCS